MTSPGFPQFDNRSSLTMVGDLRTKWGWFVGLGALAVVCGFIALTLTATTTVLSVVVIGVLMVVTGASEIAIGFRARGWGRALSWELTGLLYVVAGVLAIVEPVPASVVITLLLGAGLVAAGVVRIVAGMRAEPPFRTPLILAGTVTTLLGFVIVIGWPGNSMLILGTLLGVDLLFSGIGWIFFGLRLRPRA